MFGSESSLIAGKSNASRQFKEPELRTSKTFQDSDIFGLRSSNPSVNNNTRRDAQKISRTFQDSNIFGYKDSNSSTVTDNARREAQRPATAHKRVIAQKSEITEVFVDDDKTARERLKKSSNPDYEPTYHKSSPTKRYVTEFFGEQHEPKYDGVLIRPQTAAGRSVTLTSSNANETKHNELQSNIFMDDSKVIHTQRDDDGDKLLSVASKWDSKESNRRNANLRKSEDLSSSQLTSFAQNKKKMEMGSDIFNVNKATPKVKEELDFETKPQNAGAKFLDKKNEEVRRTQHLFSDILGHEDKNYTYEKNNAQGDPMLPTNVTWSDSKTENMSPKKPEKKENQPAGERKLAHLASSEGSTMALEASPTKPVKQAVISEKALEREAALHMSPQLRKGLDLKSEVPLGESSQNWASSKPPANDSAYTFDFDLKSIPKNMDMDTLKKVFSGYHVVELKADRNHVAASQLDSGRVKIRANAGSDLLKLKHDLKNHGILMLSHFEKHNKKSNYRDLAKINWHDQYLQNEEGRIRSSYTTNQESKLKNLESEGDVFGNSKGVGKWDRSVIQKVKKTSENIEQKSPEDVVKTLNWKNSIKGVTNTSRSSVQNTKKPVIQKAFK